MTGLDSFIRDTRTNCLHRSHEVDVLAKHKDYHLALVTGEHVLGMGAGGRSQTLLVTKVATIDLI